MHTCLIVANNEATQREFVSIVRALKFATACASSISEASRRLRDTELLAVIVIDEWWRNGEDPLCFVRQLPMSRRPPIMVVQKVRLTALGNGADYAVHRDDPSGLNDTLAEIELRAHELAAAAEPELQQAAE